MSCPRDRNKHCRPSTFVIRLQDKLSVRRSAKELSPSIRRIWFDDRSKCCKQRRWLSPSILAMQLLCRLSVCRSELRETSSKLRRKVSAISRAASFPGGSAPRSLYPAPPSAPPRPRPLIPSRYGPRSLSPPQQRPCPTGPSRQLPHLLMPLSMRLSSPGTERPPAMP